VTSHPLLPGRIWQPGDKLSDTPERWDVAGSRRHYDGGFISVREDTVTSPGGDEFDRAVVEHKGAVGVVAIDADDRVLLLRQYRHAAGRRLLELPAGILDVDDEPDIDAAARELTEETDVVAAEWSHLVELWSSPGMTDEHWHVFVARDLRAAPVGSVPERQHEEAYMEVVWVPLADAVAAVLDRRITDAMAMVGLLAVWAQRHQPPARTG
jgi:ADP-ribose pyrophosphatase